GRSRRRTAMRSRWRAPRSNGGEAGRRRSAPSRAARVGRGAPSPPSRPVRAARCSTRSSRGWSTGAPERDPMSLRTQRVVVIGAGVGGLSAAARLARQGFEVEVFEKGAGPGGRCGQLACDGFTFDTGPTLLLMPEVLEETFAAAGRKVSDYLELTR